MAAISSGDVPLNAVQVPCPLILLNEYMIQITDRVTFTIPAFTPLLLCIAFVGQPYHGHTWGSCTGYGTANRQPYAQITSWPKVWFGLV